MNQTNKLFTYAASSAICVVPIFSWWRRPLIEVRRRVTKGWTRLGRRRRGGSCGSIYWSRASSAERAFATE